MAQVNRQQTTESESQLNTRQDRNTFVTDGGTWTWDQGTGTLSWSGTIVIHRAGRSADTINSGSITGVTTTGDSVYVDVNRDAGSQVYSVSEDPLGNPALFATDTALALGARGVDGKFYFRNGTVMSDGDSKLFGQLNSVTDRNDIVSTGVALNAVGFTYVTGSNQLAVYVGGILQILGVHYTETSSTQITFSTGFIPPAGERISFVNIIGGEGPAATGTVSLQDAWSVGNQIDVSSASGLDFVANTSQQVMAVRSPVGAPITKMFIRGDGAVVNNSGETGLVVYTNDFSGDAWVWYPVDDGGKDAMFLNLLSSNGFRLSSTGLIECGQYTGGSFGDGAPGGSWTGDGGIRWSVYAGTLSTGTNTDIATGLTGILGAVFAVRDGVTGRDIINDVATGSTSNKQFGITFDPISGDIRISANAAGDPDSPGGHVDGEAYTLIVFHQG